MRYGCGVWKSEMRRLLLLLLFASAANAQVVTMIDPPAGAGAAEPCVSSTSSGVLLSWLEPRGEQVALRFSRLSDRRWSEPRTIAERSDFFVNWADFPSIVSASDGTLFAHWLQKSGSDVYAYDVRMSTSTDGGRTWRPSFPLNRDGRKTEHGFVSLLPLSKGRVAATWLDGRNMPEGKEEGEMTVRYAEVDANGRILNERELDHRACECCTTGIAPGPLVVYRDRSTEEVRDIAIARRQAGTWRAPALVHRDGWKIAGCPVNGPRIDAREGSVVVAWFTGANDRPRVFAAFSRDGGATFSDPLTVDDGKPGGRVDVVLLAPDVALVSWVELTGSTADIRVRLVRPRRIERSAVVAPSSAARAAGFPRMTSWRGGAVMTWTDVVPSKKVRVARIEMRP
jgi:hypothetical protein